MVRFPAIIFLLVSDFIQGLRFQECYSNSKLHTIPENHLYWKLKKPLVIGYMGNIAEFQENSFEGIKSLIQIKADGVHMQIQLTKDDQIILFGDKNLMRMTGEDFLVSNLPYSEIFKMTLQQSVSYSTGNQTFFKVYRSAVKIPLLTSVLELLYQKDLLIYIEIIPFDVVPLGPFDRQLADITARLLSDVIKKYDMEKQVFVVSKNPFPLKSMSYFAPNVALAWWIGTELFNPVIANEARLHYHDLLDTYPQKCFQGKPNGTGFTKYLITSGVISKSVNASFLDLSAHLFHGKQYMDSKETLDSYKNVTLGYFDIFTFDSFDHNMTSEQDVRYIGDVYNMGVRRFITGDVNRVKKALHEVITVYSTGHILQQYFVLVLLAVLLTKTLLSLAVL